jgi:hypothetical protein
MRKHSIHFVRSFEILNAYTIRVCFEDGTQQIIDLEPVLEGELYGPLRDPEVFQQAHLDPIAHTLVWPNGADFDPAILHDWPQHKAEFHAAAKRWALVQHR